MSRWTWRVLTRRMRAAAATSGGADERDPSGRMVGGEAEVVDVAEAAIQEFREFCGTVEYGHADDGHDRAYASARHADLRVGRGCV